MAGKLAPYVEPPRRFYKTVSAAAAGGDRAAVAKRTVAAVLFVLAPAGTLVAQAVGAFGAALLRPAHIPALAVALTAPFLAPQGFVAVAVVVPTILGHRDLLSV